MAYLIRETYLGDIQPRQMFDYYLAKDLGSWVTNINDMFVTDDENEAKLTMARTLAKEHIEAESTIFVYKRTADVVEKDDDYLAKMYLGTEGYGV